jgi:hypothetical protein
LFFCCVDCWNAHVPVARHRDAWAEEQKAPTREAWVRQLAQEQEQSKAASVPSAARAPEAPSGDIPRDVLIVVSKLKAYVRAKSGFNTSDGIMDLLSDHVRMVADEAVRVAAQDGRRTVLDRDVKAALEKLVR